MPTSATNAATIGFLIRIETWFVRPNTTICRTGSHAWCWPVAPALSFADRRGCCDGLALVGFPGSFDFRCLIFIDDHASESIQVLPDLFSAKVGRGVKGFPSSRLDVGYQSGFFAKAEAGPPRSTLLDLVHGTGHLRFLLIRLLQKEAEIMSASKILSRIDRFATLRSSRNLKSPVPLRATIFTGTKASGALGRMEAMEGREPKRSTARARSSERSGAASPREARAMNQTTEAAAPAAVASEDFLAAAQRAEEEIGQFVEAHQVTDRVLDLVMSV